MGFIFGGGGGDPKDNDQRGYFSKTDSSPDTNVKKQEQKVQRQEQEERRKVNQRMRKMRTGGMSQLLGDRDDPAQGNPVNVQKTLGPDRNPR